jgi:hypothetical protein
MESRNKLTFLPACCPIDSHDAVQSIIRIGYISVLYARRETKRKATCLGGPVLA